MIFDRVKIDSSEKAWFTSDLHFFHKNVLKFDDAPFRDIKERDEAIIKSWNEKVRPDDWVFIMGDFSLGKFEGVIRVAERLIGKLVLVLGNHDNVVKNNPKLQNYFHTITPYLELEIKTKGRRQLICLNHYPIWEWNQIHRGAYHLYGHVHRNDDFPLRFDYKCLNIGIMNHDYELLSFEEIDKTLRGRKNKDHH